MTHALANLADSGAAPRSRQELFSALAGLDRLLERALDLARTVYGWEPGNTRFRGLFTSVSDAARMLRREPAASPFEGAAEEVFHSLELPSIEPLCARCHLDWFDRAILLIAAAPELDARYERVYAFLQDDVTRKRPSVDLILNLLCGTAGEKLDRRSHFSGDSNLVRGSVIHLLPEPNQPEPPLISHWVKVDEQVVRMLLGSGGIDSRLAGSAEFITRDLPLSSIPLEPGQAEGLRRFALRQRASGEPLRVQFAGPPMPLKKHAAEALASEMGRPLLALDVSRAAEPAEALRVAAREAELRDALLFVNTQGPSGDAEPNPPAGLEDALRGTAADVLLAAHGTPQAGMPPFLPVDFEPASFDTRRRLWREHARACGLELEASQLDSLGGLFRLYPDQVASAVLDARNRARWRGESAPAIEDLAAAARSQSRRRIESLATRIAPVHTWADIVLPPGTLSQLRALCTRVTHRHRVLESWGFDRKLSTGKGATALFAGPSGTGKTMAAEVVARELGLELYKIDLSGIVSKYIGETEKNLERIFSAAENANAILFFDEADALFGKRSEVRDSHDRYANIEVSYLLQRMEMYDGMAILASNLRQHLDESFVRRLAFTIHFPFPDAEQRRRIWTGIWPPEAPRAADIDLDFLASKFKLSGGNIKNVALAAAFLGAEQGGEIEMRHLLTAVEREFQKMGKPLSDEQAGRAAKGVRP